MRSLAPGAESGASLDPASFTCRTHPPGPEKRDCGAGEGEAPGLMDAAHGHGTLPGCGPPPGRGSGPRVTGPHLSTVSQNNTMTSCCT